MTKKPFNRLYYGDCLTIMTQEMKAESVDLIYLDPPFKSARDYNAIYKDETGRPLPDQISAFCDTWTFNEETERTLRIMPELMRENGMDNEVAEFWRLWMNALRKTDPDLLAYLSYMTERLLPMKSILKPKGSIYLHCDQTASHYIKVLMDAIFGNNRFQNEIIWHYRRWTGKAKRFQRLHDTILFYTNGNNHNFNTLYTDYTIESKARKEGGVLNRMKDGEVYKVSEKGELDERGVRENDVWQISILNSQAKERMGYATQKPVELLERIIKASSNEGDVVFDPFCGCATTIEAAHKLNRRWIGIDIAIHAIKRVASVRLQDRLGLVEGPDFYIKGIPQTMEGAMDLWERDKYHFQKWAVEGVDGFVTSRKSGDSGIDGRLYFTKSDKDKDLSTMLLEVKGGKSINVSVLRDLRGTMERESAEMAGLIIMESLGEKQTANFKREMASAGVLNLNGVEYPRMQMITVQEILDGKRFVTPSRVAGRGERQPVLPLNAR